MPKRSIYKRDTEETLDPTELERAAAAGCHPDPAESVAVYFERQLGRALDDPQTPDRNRPARFSPYHPDFNIDTTCGEECRLAIDAAFAFVCRIRDAFGLDSDDEKSVVRACERVVLCNVYG